MRLAISNIAWDVAQDEQIASLLERYGVDAIDIAPGKYFPQPLETSAQDIARVKRFWRERGVEITGMQALLFGTSGMNMFGTQQSQSAMLEHLTAICRIGAELGATRLVFGSPKNRDRSALNDQQTAYQATQFFRQLGDIALAAGVNICLEPNPACYGANFMTDSGETARVVRLASHPAIRMQLDTGALTINDEDPAILLQARSDLIGHIHISEPQLVPLGDGKTEHARMAQAIRQYLPNHPVTIEMLATVDEPPADAIERALRVASWHYRKPIGNIAL
jgi:sugar phosphate isomerase/epimerase